MFTYLLTQMHVDIQIAKQYTHVHAYLFLYIHTNTCTSNGTPWKATPWGASLEDGAWQQKAEAVKFWGCSYHRAAVNMGFSKNQEPLFGSPFSKDHNILGSILGPAVYGSPRIYSTYIHIHIRSVSVSTSIPIS